MATKPTKPTKWDRLPSLTEDVVGRSREDIASIRRGMGAGASKLAGTAQEVVKEAGARGLTRMAGRVSPAAAAFEAGYAGGRALDEETGVGKAAVNKSNVGKAAAEALSKSDRVKLSEKTKERLADMENDKSMRQIDKEKEDSKYGKGEYAKGGMVKANCGASVPPSQKGKK